MEKFATILLIMSIACLITTNEARFHHPLPNSQLSHPRNDSHHSGPLNHLIQNTQNHGKFNLNHRFSNWPSRNHKHGAEMHHRTTSSNKKR
ncbi:hypothetical protein BpHYR1_004739 [Brachionus plicatilis]|uniref:Uncharacterized protein n=1 Tax=Brachionus plicatilis TaxID=10195 RepID=A0A3M7PMP8_BRAPC|nr:hypothetical protein BpHYR1_004739 [Brachionus plicatilis]